MTETETKAAGPGSAFWRFSLTLYRQPGVPEACLALQEQAGVDVNLLLFLLWRATAHRAFSMSEVANLDEVIRPWREAAVIPLRAIRRALKDPPGLVTGPVHEVFRNRIKAIELEAERLQQEAMFELPQGQAAGSDAASRLDAARDSIRSYEGKLKATFPAQAVESMLVAFGALHPD